jgi:hypothetical protein
MLKVVDQFTTRDGEWYPSNKPYSITKEAAEKYAHLATGAAHHIFVVPPMGSKTVEFNTLDGRNPIKMDAAGQDGNPYRLVGTPIFQAYDPVKGDGMWHVWVDGQRVTKDGEGIGLPHGWHVSTFLVVEDVPVPSEPPTIPGRDRVQVYINGVLRFDSEG